MMAAGGYAFPAADGIAMGGMPGSSLTTAAADLAAGSEALAAGMALASDLELGMPAPATLGSGLPPESAADMLLPLPLPSVPAQYPTAAAVVGNQAPTVGSTQQRDSKPAALGDGGTHSVAQGAEPPISQPLPAPTSMADAPQSTATAQGAAPQQQQQQQPPASQQQSPPPQKLPQQQHPPQQAASGSIRPSPAVSGAGAARPSPVQQPGVPAPRPSVQAGSYIAAPGAFPHGLNCTGRFTMLHTGRNAINAF